MTLHVALAQRFDETDFITDLKGLVQLLDSSLFSSFQFKTELFQEQLTNITTKQMEGEQLEENVLLKYHFTLGELEEINRLTPILERFVNRSVASIDHMKRQCVEDLLSPKEKDTARQFNLFFLDTIMASFEKTFNELIQDFEATKTEYAKEQMHIAFLLITNNHTEEEAQKLKEKQAFLVGKTTLLQSRIDYTSKLWNAWYGTSFKELLNNLRMDIFYFLSNCKDHTIQNT